MMSDIFVSYSRKDEAFVKQLTDALHQRGARFWLDQYDIAIGQDWRRGINEGLRDAEVLILVVSPDSMRSANVEREWRAFLKVQKPIYPIVHRDTLLPKALEHLNYLRFDKQPFDASIDFLVDELKRSGLRFQQPLGSTAQSGVVSISTPVLTPNWGKWAVIVASFALVIGAVVTLAQPFIADWLVRDDLPTQTVVSGTGGNTLMPSVTVSPAVSATPVPPTATFVPLVVGSAGLSLSLGSENTLMIVVTTEADVNALSLANASGGSDSPMTTFGALSFLGGRLQAGTCLIYRREGTADRLPRECVPAQTYEVELPAIDIFWYDDATNRALDIIVRRDGQNVNLCSAASTRCNVSW